MFQNHLDKTISNHAHRTWSKSQEIIGQENGSIILSVETSGWWDVKRWVLSYGSGSKVLEPEGLKNEIRDELETARELYACPDEPVPGFQLDTEVPFYLISGNPISVKIKSPIFWQTIQGPFQIFRQYVEIRTNPQIKKRSLVCRSVTTSTR